MSILLSLLVEISEGIFLLHFFLLLKPPDWFVYVSIKDRYTFLCLVYGNFSIMLVCGSRIDLKWNQINVGVYIFHGSIGRGEESAILHQNLQISKLSSSKLFQC